MEVMTKILKEIQVRFDERNDDTEPRIKGFEERVLAHFEGHEG